MHQLLVLLALGLCLVFAPSARSQDDSLAPLVQVLAQSVDAQFQLDILKGMSDGLKGRRNVPMPAGWEELAKKLSQSANPQIRELVQSLSLTFGSSGALTALRRQLADAQLAPAARLKALEALVAAKDPSLAAVLQQLLKDPALRGAALRGLAAYDDAQTPAAILAVYPSLNPAEKRDALGTLAARVGFARALVAAIAAGKLAARDLSADIVQQLSSLRQKDIDEQIAKLWGVARASAADKLTEIAKYKRMIQAPRPRPDDPMHGRAVFSKVCQQCHTLYGVGGKIGPDLTGSNRADLDYVLHNALDPNAEIPHDYRTSTLDTKDDRVITGIVTRQDSQSVTVVTANETLTIPRGDILTLRQSELSMMPEGLLTPLKDQEVRDLVAYLRTPGQVPLLATVDTLGSFFDEKTLANWDGDAALWKVENGEIVGRSQGLKRNVFLKSEMAFGDFRLVVRVKLAPNNGNSGIQFRSAALPDSLVKGYQADVGVGWWGKLYEEHGRGLMWKESGEAHVKAGDWNTYEIVAVGPRILTAINGKRCVDLEDTAGARQGIIAFQLHSGAVPFEVRYRDFRLELDPKLELVTAK